MRLKDFLWGFEGMDPEATVFVLYDAGNPCTMVDMVRGPVLGMRYSPEEGVLIYFDQDDLNYDEGQGYRD